MATTPIFTGAPRSPLTQFNSSYGTRFRPLCTAGSSGSRIEQLIIASTDAGANTLQLGAAHLLTSGQNMGSGLFVDGGGGSDTITRSSGSFVTDGWVVGDRLALLGSTTLANDFFAILTAVASGTLTFATGTVSVAEALAASTGLYRLGFLGQLAVAITAGSSTTAAVSGLSPTLIPSIDPSPDRNLRLGPNVVLMGAVGTILGASETIDVTSVVADY